MPSATQGFTKAEIKTRVQRFIGNDSEEFTDFVDNAVAMAEFRFCKLHDWSFLRKQSLSLSVTNGTAEYTLDTASIGYEMSAANVETIYSPDKSTVLRKVDLRSIRRSDPEEDDGSSTQGPQVWAPVGENKILFWPPVFETGTLEIDGKISPTALVGPAADSSYPTIPFKYQESFIEYIIALAMDRENDDRAAAKKSEAIAMIRQDIEDDMRDLGGIIEPRMKHWREARFDGAGANLEALLFGLVFDQNSYE